MNAQSYRRYIVYGPKAVSRVQQDRALDHCMSISEARQSARMRGKNNVIFSYAEDPNRPHVLIDERFEEVVYS